MLPLLVLIYNDKLYKSNCIPAQVGLHSHRDQYNRGTGISTMPCGKSIPFPNRLKCHVITDSDDN